MQVSERRSGPRPNPGELKVCANCKGLMQFTEKYIRDADQAMRVCTAAWVCMSPSCHAVDFVRTADAEGGPA
jgi:hypothetical protein